MTASPNVDEHKQKLRDIELRIATAFNDSGHELFLVGGAVRDDFLNTYPHELDFATSAHPRQSFEILTDLRSGRPYTVGEKFGTIGLHLPTGNLEITTYRSGERYAKRSRKPVVEFGTSLDEDLRRRDFTINAMAREPISGGLIDPLGGRKDLTARVLRAVGDPSARFTDDPLRVLRGVRFASQLDLSVEPATWNALTESSSLISSISRERVRDEVSKILMGPDPGRGLVFLRDAGLLEPVGSSLVELTLLATHGPSHPLSLWDHTMRVLDAVPEQLVVRWAALLHDIAKASTRTVEPSGRVRFPHHEVVGAEMARELLMGLRYPNQLVSDVALLVETHMQMHAYSSEWTSGAVRRLVLRLGRLLPLAFALARADSSGHSDAGEAHNAPGLDTLEQRAFALGAESADTPASPLSGNELIHRYGRPPGPWIGRIKRALEEEILEGHLQPTDSAHAWKIADQLLKIDSEP